MNGEHMVAGSEENKRQDFTVNSIQGWELTMTEFKHRTWFPGILEIMWGWQKRVLESRMGRKLISKSLWVLWDITLEQCVIWGIPLSFDCGIGIDDFKLADDQRNNVIL